MQIYFILVEPAYPENIGSAARAIKTMGFNKLRLVNPTDHLVKEARWLAHASNEILENAEIFSNFDQAILDIDLTIASTAKRRSVKFDYIEASDLPELLKEKNKSIDKVAIVFGKEESGLDNEIIRKCDLASYIPMKTKYPSLNLAQAAMIYAYEISKLNLQTSQEIEPLVEKKVFPVFKQKLDSLLLELRIEKNENLYHRILERAAQMKDEDINLSLSILNRIR
jgi:tRNA/rRNA methyltransferase